MESLDPRNVKGYRSRGALSTGLGLAGMVVTGAALFDRSLLGTSAAGQTLDGPLDELWLLCYFLGCAGAFLGVQWRPVPIPALEAVGLRFLLFAMVINAAAIVILRGPVAGGVTAAGLLGLAFALWRRIRDLHHSAEAERRISDLPFPGDGRRVDDSGD